MQIFFKIKNIKLNVKLNILFNSLFYFLIYATSLTAKADNIIISTVSNLSFGKIASDGSGSVTVTTNGLRTRSGAVNVLSSGPGSAAIFNISGTAGQAYIITLPSDNSVALTSSGTSINLTLFTITPGDTGVLSGTGTQTINIGATLNFDSRKTPGNYDGNFSFSIDYQ